MFSLGKLHALNRTLDDTDRQHNSVCVVVLKKFNTCIISICALFLGDSCEINIDECTRLVEIVSEFKGGARNIIEISKSSSVNGSILFRMIRLSRFTPFLKRHSKFGTFSKSEKSSNCRLPQ